MIGHNFPRPRDIPVCCEVDVMWDTYGDKTSIKPGNGPRRLANGKLFRQGFIRPANQYQGIAAVGIVGDPSELATLPDGPLVRIHSECSDSRHLPTLVAYYEGTITAIEAEARIRAERTVSKDCDCYVQSEDGQRRIAAEGGVFIDLAQQNCRSLVGSDALLSIALKKAIYRLKEEAGLNTVEACHALGFLDPDARDYGHIADFCKDSRINFTAVQLLTGNLRKVRALEVAGIRVTRAPHRVGVTPTNYEYVETKVKELGHFSDGLEDMRNEG